MALKNEPGICHIYSLCQLQPKNGRHTNKKLRGLRKSKAPSLPATQPWPGERVGERVAVALAVVLRVVVLVAVGVGDSVPERVADSPLINDQFNSIQFN